jgi:hypothetical protein
MNRSGESFLSDVPHRVPSVVNGACVGGGFVGSVGRCLSSARGRLLAW